MFKSVFTKYVTAFMVIIVISFIILAAIISSMTVKYSVETQRDTVYNSASTVKVNFENDINNMLSSGENAGPPFDFGAYITSNQRSISRDISTLTRFTGDLIIFATDMDGQILVIDSNANTEVFNSSIISANAIAEVGKDQLLTTLDGIFSTPYFVYSLPVLAGSQKVGYIFACSASTAANEFVEVMVKMIVMDSLWVMLAALIAVYFISEKVISPLKDMSYAAKSFASGKFNVRVPVAGHDEVAELAVAFNNMAASLEHLEDTRRTFLANVSHDLRTPMTSISGFIDGILDGTIPPDKHAECLAHISTEVKRLSRLVVSLLDITRIQAGERKFNKTSFDICEMAREILISFEQRIDEKHLDIEFDCEAENMSAFADRDAIYQILYNICDNAVKFVREGGKLRIKIGSKEKKVYISVYNEGQGIPEEDLPYVFDRFYKSDKSRGLDKSGAGLGLYIAKTIIEAHGEEIRVRSVWGEYCEFIFTLAKGKN